VRAVAALSLLGAVVVVALVAERGITVAVLALLLGIAEPADRLGSFLLAVGVSN